MSLPEIRSFWQWSHLLWLGAAGVMAVMVASLADAERVVGWAQKMWALLLHFHDKPIRRTIESQDRREKLKANPNILTWDEDSFIREFDRKPSSVRHTLLRLEKAGVIHEVSPGRQWRPGKKPERKPLWG